MFAMAAGPGGGGVNVGVGVAGGGGPGGGGAINLSEEQLRELLRGMGGIPGMGGGPQPGGGGGGGGGGGNFHQDIQGFAQNIAMHIAEAAAQGAFFGDAHGAGGPEGAVDPAPAGLIDSLVEMCLDKETIDVRASSAFFSFYSIVHES